MASSGYNRTSISSFKLAPKLNFFQEEPLPDAPQTVDTHHNCYALRNWRPNGFKELADASKHLNLARELRILGFQHSKWFHMPRELRGTWEACLYQNPSMAVTSIL